MRQFVYVFHQFFNYMIFLLKISITIRERFNLYNTFKVTSIFSNCLVTFFLFEREETTTTMINLFFNMEKFKRRRSMEYIFIFLQFIWVKISIVLSLGGFIFIPADSNKSFVRWRIYFFHNLQSLIHLIFWHDNEIDTFITFPVHFLKSLLSLILGHTFSDIIGFFKFSNGIFLS